MKRFRGSHGVDAEFDGRSAAASSRLGGAGGSRMTGSSYAGSSIGGESKVSDMKQHNPPAGHMEVDWIAVLGAAARAKKSNKKNAGGDKGPTLNLPSAIVPSMKWETIPHCKSGTIPPVRQGHTLLAMTQANDKRSGSELFFVSGGCEELPLRVAGSATAAASERAALMGSSSWRASQATTSAVDDSATGTQAPPLRRRGDIGPTAMRISGGNSTPATFSGGAAKQGESKRSTIPGKTERSNSPMSPGKKQAVYDPNEVAADWHTPSLELPRRLVAAVACVLSSGLRIAVFGGVEFDGDRRTLSGALRILEVSSGRWRDESKTTGGPPPCYEHAASAAEGSRSMIVHGGVDSFLPEDDSNEPKPLVPAYTLEVNDRSVAWEVIQPLNMEKFKDDEDSFTTLAKPPPRRAHSLTVQGDHAAFLFGGIDEEGTVTADLRVLDLERRMWLLVEAAGPAPLARAYHSAVLIGPFLAIFGGVSPQHALLKDLRLLHCSTLVWIAPKLSEAVYEPPARAWHAMAPVAAQHPRAGVYAILVFGGRVANGEPSGDLHRLTLTTKPTPSDSAWHTSLAYRYVLREIRTAMDEKFEEHHETTRGMHANKVELEQEERNTETKMKGSTAEVNFHSRTQKTIVANEIALQAQIAEETHKLNTNKYAATARLRELQIEIDSLQAKVNHVKQHPPVDALERAEVVFDASEPDAEEFIENKLCPNGVVIRRDCHWRNAIVGAEIIEPTRNPQFDACKPGLGERRLALPQEMGDAWIQAVRRELNILKLPRHPCVQEIYGAIMDGVGVLLLCQRFPLTLATLLETTGRDPIDKLEPLTENLALHLTSDIVAGLDFLHCKGIAHRHVVAFNIFVEEESGGGAAARLGGHFPARVACRVSESHLVVDKQAWVYNSTRRPYASSLCCKLEQTMGIHDVRPADVVCLGYVLMDLWLAASQGAIEKLAAIIKWIVVKKEGIDPESPVPSELQELLLGVRDEQVRKVIVSCLLADEEGILPTVRVIKLAFEAVLQGEDMVDLPSAGPNDPSKTELLAEVAGLVDDDDARYMEEHAPGINWRC